MAPSNNPDSLGFLNWLEYIRNEAKSMSELENSDIIKKFSNKQTSYNYNPPKIVNSNIKTLLITNS
jgi:hypothetical protein